MNSYQACRVCGQSSVSEYNILEQKIIDGLIIGQNRYYCSQGCRNEDNKGGLTGLLWILGVALLISWRIGLFEALFGFFVFIAVVMAIVAIPVWGARNRARTIHGPYLKVISENKGDHIEKHPENTEFLEEYLSEPELTELRQLDKEDVDEIPTGNQATKLLDCLTNTACVEKHWNIQSLRNKRKKDLSIIHITDNNTFYYNLRLIYFIC